MLLNRISRREAGNHEGMHMDIDKDKESLKAKLGIIENYLKGQLDDIERRRAALELSASEAAEKESEAAVLLSKVDFLKGELSRGAPAQDAVKKSATLTDKFKKILGRK